MLSAIFQNFTKKGSLYLSRDYKIVAAVQDDWIATLNVRRLNRKSYQGYGIVAKLQDIADNEEWFFKRYGMNFSLENDRHHLSFSDQSLEGEDVSTYSLPVALHNIALKNCDFDACRRQNKLRTGVAVLKAAGRIPGVETGNGEYILLTMHHTLGPEHMTEVIPFTYKSMMRFTNRTLINAPLLEKNQSL